MKKKILFIAWAFLFSFYLMAQNNNVGIGTLSPDPSAVLEIESTTQGVLIPRMTTNQINSISNAAEGLLVYDTVTGSFKFRKSGVWKDLSESDSKWDSNTDDIYNSNVGNVGVGTSDPFSKLDISKDLGPDLSLTRLNALSSSNPSAQEKIASLLFRSQSGNIFRTGAIIRARQDNIWNPLDTRVAPTALEFYTQDVGFPTTLNSPRMTLDSEGFLGIGKEPSSVLDVRSNKPNLVLESSDAIEQVAGRELISRIDFRGHRNDVYRDVAYIAATQRGAWSANDAKWAPTDLKFYLQSAGDLDALGTPKMTITTSGHVGIGTEEPQRRLHVVRGVSGTFAASTNSSAVFENDTDNYLTMLSPVSSQFRTNGNISRMSIDSEGKLGVGKSPTSILDIRSDTPRLNLESSKTIGLQGVSSEISRISFRGQINNLYREAAFIQAEQVGVWSQNNANWAPTELKFYTQSAGTGNSLSAPRMIINAGGNVEIGNAGPAAGYRLSVDGKIACEELRVELSESWPDYVFAKEYHLPSLEAVKYHIETRGHLPGIPSAEEIEKEGLELGEMQRNMMEKIEELTLYIIAQNERIEALETELNNRK